MRYNWEQVGKNIKHLREASLKTRYQLAVEIKMCHTSLCDIENGVSTPRLTSMVRIADALGCKVDDFLTGVRVK